MSAEIGADYIDSQDIQERIDELKDELDIEGELDDDDTEELALWEALKEETEDSGWKYGIGFILEDEFEDYAQEFAADIGAISRGCSWPASCIDWEQAARELAMDYSTVEIGDYSYYYHEA